MDTVRRISEKFSLVKLNLEMAKAKARNDLAGVGVAMRAIREEHGYGLRELAKRIGISAPFLADVELGRRTASKEVFEKWIKEVAKK